MSRSSLHPAASGTFWALLLATLPPHIAAQLQQQRGGLSPEELQRSSHRLSLAMPTPGTPAGSQYEPRSPKGARSDAPTFPVAAPLPLSAQQQQPLVLAVLGDSLTAGYGLSPSAALPVQLQSALARVGVASEVVGLGVSGDTTADGLRRVERVVPAHSDLCLVALGGNDLLRRVPLAQVRANLEGILQCLRARGVPALLAGVRVPPLLDPAYVSAFSALYDDLAREHRVPLYPSLLDGILLDPRLNLPDLVHPNAQGVQVIAARLAPFVMQAARDTLPQRWESQAQETCDAQQAQEK